MHLRKMQQQILFKMGVKTNPGYVNNIQFKIKKTKKKKYHNINILTLICMYGLVNFAYV